MTGRRDIETQGQHDATAHFGSHALFETLDVGQSFLPPRMTTTVRDALTAINGMLIYNTSHKHNEAYIDDEWKHVVAVPDQTNTALKSYTFSSRGIIQGTYYVGGFYEAPAADCNLDEGSTTQTLGGANVPYGAHAFLVAAAAGAAAGGSGAVTIVVSGTSVTDLGVRDASGTETIVADITGMSTDAYYETTLKWIGQVTYTLTVGATGHTTYNADFNYGFAKYEDFANRDFTIRDFETTGLAAANDSSFDVQLLHHKDTGWTYSAAAFVPGTGALISLVGTYSTESDTDSASYFAYKRTGLSTAVTGTDIGGTLVKIICGQNNTVQRMDVHVGVEI